MLKAAPIHKYVILFSTLTINNQKSLFLFSFVGAAHSQKYINFRTTFIAFSPFFMQMPYKTV